MNETMYMLLDTVRQRAAIDLGIAPLTADDGEQVVKTIDKRLAELPPEEARKMKRKYRKLWRKYLKQVSGERQGRVLRENEKYYEKGKRPSGKAKMRRKAAVWNAVGQSVADELNAIRSAFTRQNVLYYFDD